MNEQIKNEIIRRNTSVGCVRVLKVIVLMLVFCALMLTSLIGTMYMAFNTPPTKRNFELKTKLVEAQTRVSELNETVLELQMKLSDSRADLAALKYQESISVMTVRATTIAQRVMQCDGEPGAAHCVPAGINPVAHPEIIVGPVVTCLHGKCEMVRE